MKKIVFPVIILSLYLTMGCTKDSTAPVKVIKVENALFATAVGPQLAQTYTTQACTTVVKGDTLAGEACIDARGTNCKTIKSCTPIPNIIQSGLYTQEEADQAIKLVEKAYGVKYTY